MEQKKAVVSKKGFDWRTHIRDPKSAEIVIRQPYVYHVSKTGEYIVRGGKKFSVNGAPLGTAKADTEVSRQEDSHEKAAAQQALEKMA